MYRTVVFVGLSSLLMVLTGCASTGYHERYQERAVDSHDGDEVMLAAAQILHREFGRLEQREGQRLVAGPAVFSTVRSSGTARDLYRGRTTMRRTATFELGEREDQLVARLRIDVERQDTQRQRVMQPRGYRINDTPGDDTPLTRDAATTERQNTVWTYVRRDTRLERAVLEELQERFARSADEPASTESTPEPAADD